LNLHDDESSFEDEHEIIQSADAALDTPPPLGKLDL